MAKKLAFSLGLILLLGSATASASPDEVKWIRAGMPGEEMAGDWVLALGSDIQHLTIATDGTLYGYGKGLDYTLYKSEDGGHGWACIAHVEDDIAAIAAAPDGAIYYATEAAVFKSTDGGRQFVRLTGNPGGAGSDNVAITSIDVATRDGENTIAVATRDGDNSQFGGVYILDESKPSSGWADTSIGSYDVYAVAFSPDFATDQQLVAVATDETNTFVTTMVGTYGWGQTAGNAKINIAADTSARIAFPDDYHIADSPALFVAIDAGDESGDVYMVNLMEAPGSSVATDLDIGDSYGLSSVDVTSLATSGKAANARLIAGAAGSAEVYLSSDGGESWTRSTKPPTGGAKTYVVIDAENSQAYAATSGSGSAVSITRDGGITWNQCSLIDTKISAIIDLAPSPHYRQDKTIFMLTWGGGHSLWRSSNGGESWARVYATDHADVDQIDHVELPPDYGKDNEVVFIAGSSNGNPAIWKSTDNGQSFLCLSCPLAVDVWAAASDRILFIGGYDGTNGLVYHSSNGGSSYSAGVAVGGQPLHSIVLSSDYDQDETILIGDTNGWVYWSDDNGKSFAPLPADATPPPLTGAITVAFDPDFSDNSTVYAASDTADGGIHRHIIGRKTGWESIDGTLPADGMVSQLRVAEDGTLYAANFKADGGMERCLNPTYSLGPTFETVTHGLEEGATLMGLWLSDSRLWAIDTTNNSLLSYNDSLAVPVTLTSPDDEASGVGTIVSDAVRQVKLQWESLAGATSYRWQLDDDTDFSSVPKGFEGNTKTTTARLPALEPATKYYWRVRATQPVLSPWSDVWSFTTAQGAEPSAPKLYTPEDGATGVPIIPVFQWSAIAWAEGYELLIATDSTFDNPIVTKTGDYALPGTDWECDIELSHGTTYYWKVRAKDAESNSAWSATFAFTTTEPPSGQIASSEPPPAPPAPAPPSPPAHTTDWTKWLVFIGGGLLVTLVAILITMIISIVRTGRSQRKTHRSHAGSVRDK